MPLIFDMASEHPNSTSISSYPSYPQEKKLGWIWNKGIALRVSKSSHSFILSMQPQLTLPREHLLTFLSYK